MQSANDVQLGDADAQRFARFLDDLFDAELETVGIPFFARERTKLAAQNAVIGIIDVAVDDVTGAIGERAEADLPREVGDSADGVQIFALEQAQSVRIRNAFARGDLFVEIAQFTPLHKEMHRALIAERSGQVKSDCSIQFESTLKDHFGGGDDQEYRADKRVEA